MANSTTPARPKKPYPDFPLSPHVSGHWQKKIRGKTHYFGRWARRVKGKLKPLPYEASWQEALALYKAQADDLHAGRVPRVTNLEGLAVADLCNRFLTAKLRQRESGEIAARTFADYKHTTDKLVAAFGKKRLVDDLAADDFEALRADLAKHYGPNRLGHYVQWTRTVFKYAYESGLIDRPVRFGPQFKKPSRTVLRKHKANSAKRLFTADEVKQLVDTAGVQLKAMILLGINCGYGNSDVADLPLSALDLKKGWAEFPRPKTGIERKAKLWPKTITALQEALAKRPTPKLDEDTDCVFITKQGRRYVRTVVKTNDSGEETVSPINAVGVEFVKLLKKLKINGRKGLGFYSLRHTFRTIADSSKDFPAIRLVMGHVDSSIDAVYREGIDDERLEAVAEHVRTWLFGEGGESNDFIRRLTF